MPYSVSPQNELFLFFFTGSADSPSVSSFPMFFVFPNPPKYFFGFHLKSSIEEDIEFFHFHPEYAGEEKMTEFMYDYKNGERENKLCRFYKKSIQFSVVLVLN